MEALRHVSDMCNQRKRGASITDVVWRPNYNLYTEGYTLYLFDYYFLRHRKVLFH